jgi:hypothetical protein
MKCGKYLLFKVSGAGSPFNKAGDHWAELQLPAATVSNPRRLGLSGLAR